MFPIKLKDLDTKVKWTKFSYKNYLYFLQCRSYFVRKKIKFKTESKLIIIIESKNFNDDIIKGHLKKILTLYSYID